MDRIFNFNELIPNKKYLLAYDDEIVEAVYIYDNKFNGDSGLGELYLFKTIDNNEYVWEGESTVMAYEMKNESTEK